QAARPGIRVHQARRGQRDQGGAGAEPPRRGRRARRRARADAASQLRGCEDTMATPIDPGYLLPGTRIGFYRIISRIAAGGFGALYRVERDGKLYALKIAVHKREKFAPE